MTLLHIMLVSGALLALAYRFYGRVLAKLLRLDSAAATPATQLRDDVDYMPLEPRYLFGQHFSAIAAAGPIVGPILAGLAFGWLPALVWILVGSILIGGVHDTVALVASIRHRARSIAEVVREHMTPAAYLLFLAFIWIALVYIIVAFTDIVAASFVGRQTLEDGTTVRGGAVATSSLLYLALPIAMGLLLRFSKLGLGRATVLFLPLIAVAIWIGPLLPLDLAALLGVEDFAAQKVWGGLLLAYCFVASIVPLWLLLQPRGHLGGYFLLIALAAGAIGVLFGGQPIAYPAFIGWTSASGDTLVPMLFITIACGACSGFHALIASGTTSKQLRRETDAIPIGYGSMLLEALVAVVSLGCVMILSTSAAAAIGGKPSLVYAAGIGQFVGVLGVPAAIGVSFGLLAFTTFVYDTLDVCTRLGRYIIQELFGWRNAAGRWIATALTAGVPLLLLLRSPTDADGKPVAAWQLFWSLFGASNQLLAALTLLGATVWLWRTRRESWVWLVTGLPTFVMYVMSVWALLRIVGKHFASGIATTNPVPWVGLVLLGLATMMLFEAFRMLMRREERWPAALA